MSDEPRILCENLVKIYKTTEIEVVALQGLDISIAAGEVMGIIGNSGSGKSTLLNIIGGLDRPSAGTVLVDGRELLKFTDRQLVDYRRTTVGFVWQNNARNLIPYLSAEENVEIPMLLAGARRRRERARELLALVGLSRRASGRLMELSGGEQQRVAIARAIAHHPRVVFADEPTAELDTHVGLQVMKLFRGLVESGSITILMTTHDPGMMDLADTVFTMEDGRIVDER